MTKDELCILLDKKKIPYHRVDHQAAFTIEDMEKTGVCAHGNVCKNLFLRNGNGKRHFLVCVQKDKSVDLKQLGELLGSRMSFALEERLMKHLNLISGSVTPLGVLNNDDTNVEVVFDRDLLNEEAIGVHPCENTATVFLSFDDLLCLIQEHGNTVSYF